MCGGACSLGCGGRWCSGNYIWIMPVFEFCEYEDNKKKLYWNSCRPPFQSRPGEAIEDSRSAWAVSRVKASKRCSDILLNQKIPDSTLIRIHSKKSVKERWDAIVAEFTRMALTRKRIVVPGSWSRDA